MKACGLHKLVASIGLLAEGQVLMVKYRDTSRYDNQRGWFLPNDLLKHLEHPDEAAKRILKEQLNSEAQEIRLSHIESFGDGSWHLMFHYKAELANARLIVPSSNLEVIKWFSLSELPERSTVSHHGWALDVLGEMVKHKP